MVSQRDFAAVLESAVFDQDFYLKTYPDIAQAGAQPAPALLSRAAGLRNARPPRTLRSRPGLPRSQSRGSKFRDRAVPSRDALIGRAGGSAAVASGSDVPEPGLDYEATARAAGLSQGDFEAICCRAYSIKTFI